ncbi:TATA-box-binding protein [Phytophthora megakarya]|uniref:TATA-box-binding protein n=1 Tax=Phytophthora megakarya TaxID=4795 RepID=A0A225WWA0_9STRA|nr:TATA-box-binding protein [Phytophthora megakarya]
MSVSNWSTSEDENDTGAWSRVRLAEEGVAYRVVGFVNERVDIQKLALLVRNADYAPRSFSALVMRFQTPRATVLIYRSGKFVVIGATSVEDAKLAGEKLVSILKKISFPSDSSPFTVRNVVGTADVCFKIRLEGLARDHLRFTTYEPELFPGLIYRMLRPKCTLLIFISGKIVITGCKSPADGEKALGTIYPVLLEYRLRDGGSDDDDDEDESLNEDGWVAQSALI